MFYLVCYDIVSDYRRNKVSQLLEGYGIRVQRSVFECLLFCAFVYIYIYVKHILLIQYCVN